MPLNLLQPAPHTHLITSLYAALPARAQSFPVVVQEVDEQHWAGVGGEPRHTGVTGCDGQKPLISLRRDRWTAGPSAFYHEMGHACASTKDGKPIGLVAVADILTTWPAFWRSHRGGMPSDYARTDCSEGFAECCVEVLGGRVFPGYHPLPGPIKAEVRRLLGLAP